MRRLHEEGRALGRVTIERGKGWPARLLARLLGLPPSGSDVATSLIVEQREREQVWSRRFGAHPVISRQRASSGHEMSESLGPFECAFRLRATASGIDYDQVGAALVVGPFRLRLPRRFAPSVGATTWATEDRMGLEVSISAPFIGPILRYHGFVWPEAGGAAS